MDRVVLSWSGGKDAALALAELRENPDVEVVELLTTGSAATGRTSMHGLRRPVLERQAGAVGLPLRYVELPAECTDEQYDERMGAVVESYERQGVDAIAFADLFLEDVRAYREERLADATIEGRWPLWGRDPERLAGDLLGAGFRATTVSVDGDALDPSYVGRAYDELFLADLPEGVDPCGENGEFHTFVHDGPVFRTPVSVRRGERVTRPVGDGDYHYCDIHLADGPGA